MPGVGDEELTREQLRELRDKEDFLVLDVRPTLEFESGHLPGARSIPVDELEGQLAELPRDRRIIAYCRGHYCPFADEAVAMLRQHGFDAVRLDGGWLEWSAEEAAAAQTPA